MNSINGPQLNATGYDSETGFVAGNGSLSMPRKDELSDHTDNVVLLDKGVIVFILATVVCVSIIANMLIIIVINKDKVLHRAPFYYMLCISVMDMFKGIFCLPFVIEVVLHDFQWLYQEETCIALAFETSFYTTCSALGIVAIAIDRYLSLSAAKMYSKCIKVYWNRIVIATSCGVAFCISFPPVFDKDTYKFVSMEMQCTLYHLPYRENKTFGYTVTFVCMLLLTLFLYCRLFLFMRSHRRMVPMAFQPARSRDWTFLGPRTNGQILVNHVNGVFTGPLNPMISHTQTFQNIQQMTTTNISIKHNNETRLFFAISASFIVLWIPYLFQSFVKVFRSDVLLPPTFIALSTLSSFAHVAVTPVIGLFLASPIRSSLSIKFKDICQRRRYVGVASSEKT